MLKRPFPAKNLEFTILQGIKLFQSYKISENFTLAKRKSIKEVLVNIIKYQGWLRMDELKWITNSKLFP